MKLRFLWEYWLVRFVLGSLATVPLPAARWLSQLYVKSLDLAVPRLRRIANYNLNRVFPGADKQAIVDGIFRSISRMLLTFSRFPTLNSTNIERWIRYEGYRHFEEAMARGNGVLFATAHLGNWELSAFAHALMSSPMDIVVRPLDNPLINGLVEHRRTLSGNRIISKTDAARAILKSLRSQRAVGVLLDQNHLGSDRVFVDFFGTAVSASGAFVRFAHHTSAAVIPGFALWSEQEKRYILTFYPEVPMTGDICSDTQRIHSCIEAVIREHPDQWMWIHRRWKTRPPGEQPFY